MERPGENNHEHERQPGRILDEMAVIRMFRHDIDLYGSIRPETQQQGLNEELTFVAEGINAPLITRFELDSGPAGLVNKRGVELQESLTRGLRVAEAAAMGDSRKLFNVRRFVHDYHEGELLDAMVQGKTAANTIVSVSPFCDEAYISYGKKFVEELGFQPDRKLAFIRIYNRLPGNRLEVISLSVDNSDLDAFRWLLHKLGVDVPAGVDSDDFLGYRAQLNLTSDQQKELPTNVLSIYDQAMESMYGQQFKAGRPQKDEIEAWGFISKQQDLVQHYTQKLELLARNNPYDLSAKRKLTLGFWAALKDRLKASGSTSQAIRGYDSPQLKYRALEQEMYVSLQRAMANHDRLIGCGGVMSLSESLLDTDPENALASIFGDKPETLVWKKGFCRISGCPTTGKVTEVAQCLICRKCQNLFDRGIDPQKVYKVASRSSSDSEAQGFAGVFDEIFKEMGVGSFEEEQSKTQTPLPV